LEVQAASNSDLQLEEKNTNFRINTSEISLKRRN